MLARSSISGVDCIVGLWWKLVEGFQVPSHVGSLGPEGAADARNGAASGDDTNMPPEL